MSHEVEILLVEDSPEDAELTIRALRRNKIANEIQVAEDGAEALDFLFCRGAFKDRIPSQLPRLVLLDLKLPKVSGMEVLRAIRQMQRIVIKAILLIPERNAIGANVVHRLGNIDEVFKKFARDTPINLIFSRKFEGYGQHIQAIHPHPARSIRLFQMPTRRQRGGTVKDTHVIES